MPQTSKGARLSLANKIGIPVEDVIKKIESGFKWCYKCKLWLKVDNFGIDRTRHDGRFSRCFTCRRVKIKKSNKGRVSTFKGKKHTPEAKLRMSKKRKGVSKNRLGKTHTIESRIKMSVKRRQNAKRGPDNHAYKDGKTEERKGQRFSARYANWRYDVFSRDAFTCQHCGDNKGGNLVAHHIKHFAEYPELRFEISNGLTLCRECHKAIHAKK